MCGLWFKISFTMKHLYLFCKNGVAAGYGVGTYIKQLVRALKEEPIKLSVVMLHSDRKTFQVEYDDGVRYIHIPPMLTMGVQGSEEVYGRKVVAYLMVPYVDKADENVFLFNYLERGDLVRLLRSYWVDAEYIYVVHFMEYGVAMTEEELDFINTVDHLVCLSKEAVRKLKDDHKVPEEKISLIYNGVADRWRSITKEGRNFLRRKYLIREEEKVLLFVGRVDLFKGVDLLLEVMRHLLLEKDNIHLFIVGDGLLNVYMKNCAPLWKHISFTGKLSEEELDELYMIADLGVIPSWHEQCSFVGIEMMMFGLPVVVSDVPGLREMFEEQDVFASSTLCVRNDEQVVLDWARIVKARLDDLNVKNKISRCLRSCYEEKYNTDRMKMNYLCLLNG